eukprot:gene649-3958_t
MRVLFRLLHRDNLMQHRRSGDDWNNSRTANNLYLNYLLGKKLEADAVIPSTAAVARVARVACTQVLIRHFLLRTANCVWFWSSAGEYSTTKKPERSHWTDAIYVSME